MSSLQPRVVFFDIGQTLAATGEQSPRRLLGSRLQLTEREVRDAGRLLMTHRGDQPDSLAHALARILTGRKPEHIRSAVERLWEEQTGCVREIPGATPLLESLKEMGLKLGIVSNTWHPLYVSFCRNCPELNALLDYTFLSYRMGCKKPEPALYQAILNGTGAPPAVCWMVGDSYELDMEPAQRAGMRTLWVLCRPEREPEALVKMLREERPRPDWVVRSLDDILPFFQDLTGRQ
jgi:HAD superfamily hydrolase (TIGR01549 family)